MGHQEPRNTARARSSRAASSSAGPSKRIWPFSMKIARSRDREGDVEGLLDDDHRQTALLERAHDVEHLLDDHRSEPERQLVDDQHLGVTDEGHRQGQQLLLAARQVLGRRAQPVAQHREQLEHPLGVLLQLVGREHVPRHAQVLLHGQRPEGGAAADELDDADPGPELGLRVGDRPALEAHDTAVRDPEPADDPQQRGLAGAVGAEQGQHLAVRARRGRCRRAPAPARRRSRGCAPGSPGARRRAAATRWASSCSSCSSSTTRDMSWRM